MSLVSESRARFVGGGGFRSGGELEGGFGRRLRRWLISGRQADFLKVFFFDKILSNYVPFQ